MPRNFTLVTTLLFGLLAFGTGPAGAATITVTASAPDVLNGADGSCALREAITNINDGANTFADCANTGATYGTSDTITLSAGTYANAIPSTNENSNANGDLDILKSVTITGAGAATTFIDGGGIDRVFHINPGGRPGGIPVNVHISGITIRNGVSVRGPFSTGHGGGIFNNQAVLNITDCSIGNNTAVNGGGLSNEGAPGSGSTTTAVTLITNSTFVSNSASFEGGGIDSLFGSLTVVNSTFSGNSSPWGGGIHTGGVLMDTITNISNSTITGNTASLFGGGIMFNGGTSTLTASTITNNTASSKGGGIYNTFRLTITRSTISGNTATNQGGGVYNLRNATATIDSTTISGNTSVNGAGIYSWPATTTTLTNSTVSGNTASNSGGGIYNSGTANISNSTIAENSATFTGSGIWNESTVKLKNTVVAKTSVGLGSSDCFNFAGGAIPTPINSLDFDGSCGVGLLSAINPLLGPLQNNGGPTFTHALLPGSPAIDAGDAAICAAAPVNGLDQRGVTRPQGAGCDIGAFESGPSPVIGLNVNGTNFVTGNSMILTESTRQGTVPTNVDIYVALQLPDGTLLIKQPDGSFSVAITPMFSNVTASNFNGPIVNYTFTGVEPVGNYTWFAAFMQPSTLNLVGVLATAPFSFAP